MVKLLPYIICNFPCFCYLDWSQWGGKKVSCVCVCVSVKKDHPINLVFDLSAIQSEWVKLEMSFSLYSAGSILMVFRFRVHFTGLMYCLDCCPKWSPIFFFSFWAVGSILLSDMSFGHPYVCSFHGSLWSLRETDWMYVFLWAFTILADISVRCCTSLVILEFDDISGLVSVPFGIFSSPSKGHLYL